MDDVITISSPAGNLVIRPEREGDEAFRFDLFCASRSPQFTALLPPDAFQAIMRQQFHAQTASYRAEFPRARFDIVELAGQPIGRMVVDRPSDTIHIVDQAVVTEQRNRGIGSAIMRSLMNEAAQHGVPLRLAVAADNVRVHQLYLRLGFVPKDTGPIHIWLEWRGSAGSAH